MSLEKSNIIKYIMDHERKDLEEQEEKNELVYTERFDYLYSRTLKYLVTKKELYESFDKIKE